MGDGSVRFVSDTIVMREFALLVTRSGGELSNLATSNTRSAV